MEEQRKFCTRYGKHEAPPNRKMMKNWLQIFLETVSWEAAHCIQTLTVNRVVAIILNVDN